MRKDSRRPIGVFDSGVGGLTVLSSLRKFLPSQNFIYLGDTARVPYGTKSAHTIHRYTEEIFEFLEGFRVQKLVIACNSASSAFQENHWKAIPVFNVIDPAVDALVELQKKRKSPLRVLLLGTKATVQSQEYERRLFARVSSGEARQFRFYSQACPLFVPLVEEGAGQKKFARDVIQFYLEKYRRKNLDVIILGCTHYPLLKKQIASLFPAHVKILSSGNVLARYLTSPLHQTELPEHERRRPVPRGKLDVWVTDASETFSRLAKKILKEDIEPKVFELKK